MEHALHTPWGLKMKKTYVKNDDDDNDDDNGKDGIYNQNIIIIK